MDPLRLALAGVLAILAIASAAPGHRPDSSLPAAEILTATPSGHSGALRATQALPRAVVDVPREAAGAAYRWIPVMGTIVPAGAPSLAGEPGVVHAPRHPGVYALEVDRGGTRVTVAGWRLVVLVPSTEKRDGYLRGYFIGRYPTEGAGRSDRYRPPSGFMEVTPLNKDLVLSDHFRVREFLTHDQADVWPKYVIVDPLLLDKLELVMDELEATGVQARRMVVMSGFRTPQYNKQGLARGRADLSRHQFGDAADVWIDNDGDWYMDDLNGDGRRDTRDSRVMLRAVERVEKRYPELVGGAGIYPDNGAHGPFIHVDVRGRAARW